MGIETAQPSMTFNKRGVLLPVNHGTGEAIQNVMPYSGFDTTQTYTITTTSPSAKLPFSNKNVQMVAVTAIGGGAFIRFTTTTADFAIIGASFVSATDRVALASAFTNYTWASGDKLEVVTGTPATGAISLTNDYTITSKLDNNTIQLSTGGGGAFQMTTTDDNVTNLVAVVKSGPVVSPVSGTSSVGAAIPDGTTQTFALNGQFHYWQASLLSGTSVKVYVTEIGTV